MRSLAERPVGLTLVCTSIYIYIRDKSYQRYSGWVIKDPDMRSEEEFGFCLDYIHTYTSFVCSRETPACNCVINICSLYTDPSIYTFDYILCARGGKINIYYVRLFVFLRHRDIDLSK